MSEITLRRMFWAVWSSLLVAKLWLATRLPLFGDEAFYWLESRQPALAYDDVPGLAPWLIALGTSSFGDGALAVRLPFIVLGAFSAWWVCRITAGAFGERAGWQAGLLALLLPLFAVNGLLALPDVPLTLATLVCAAALLRLSTGQGGHVLLALGLALGWLSHYRFVVPFAAGGAWLLLDPQGRRLLADRRLWLAGVLGTLAGLGPLLWQQLASGGHGFAFQFAERHPWRLQPEGLADPLLQMLPTTPGMYLLLLAAALAGWRRRHQPAVAVLLGVALWTLLLFMALAPFADTERSRLHWPLPGWLLLALLAPAVAPLWADRRRWLRIAARIALGIGAAGVLGAFGYLAIAAHAPQRLAPYPLLYPTHFAGWPTVTARVRDELAGMPAGTVLAADNFMLAAQLSFGLGGRPVYSLDHPLNDKHGRDTQLERLGLDEAALRRAMPDAPALLLVADPDASRLRQRPAWFRRLCTLLPVADTAFDLSADHGLKRWIGWRWQPGTTSACMPPALGYLDLPRFGQQLAGELELRGWAIRDRVGIERLWLTIDGETIGEIPYGLPSPGVLQHFPGSDDPNHPQVGFALGVRPDLADGRHWLRIEAGQAHGPRSVLASVPIEWRSPR